MIMYIYVSLTDIEQMPDVRNDENAKLPIIVLALAPRMSRHVLV